MREVCRDCKEVYAYADSHQCLDCFDGKYVPDSYWEEAGYVNWEAYKLLQTLREDDDV
jgi:hypothetical protein